MAWLDWLIGKKDPIAGQLVAHSDVLSSQQMDYMRSSSGGKSSSAQPAATASAQRLEQRRTERNAKRELLFQVVREAMVRVGVLSSAFKFKVLSLDQRGRSFLVMIELAAEFSGEAEKLAEIENMIAQTAKHRYEIIVQAVYWRYFNSAKTSALATVPASATAPLLGAMHAPISRPAPIFGIDHNAPQSASASSASSSASAAATAEAARRERDSMSVTSSIPIIGVTAAQITASRTQTPAVPFQDDLGDDEVTAFRRALAAGASQGAMAAPALPSLAHAAAVPAAPLAARAAPGPRAAASGKPASAKPEPSTLDHARSKLLLTGYEDTEMADDDPMPALSGTQYGELR